MASNGTLSAVDTATDNQNEFTALDSAIGITTVDLEGTTYVLVTSAIDDGIQVASCGICVPSSPVITEIADQTVTSSDTFTYAVTATDADPDDIITYSLSAPTAAGAAIDSTSGIITWATGPDDVATSPHAFTVSATDGTHTVSMSFSVTVLDANPTTYNLILNSNNTYTCQDCALADIKRGDSLSLTPGDGVTGVEIFTLYSTFKYPLYSEVDKLSYFLYDSSSNNTQVAFEGDSESAASSVTSSTFPITVTKIDVTDIKLRWDSDTPYFGVLLGTKEGLVADTTPPVVHPPVGCPKQISWENRDVAPCHRDDGSTNDRFIGEIAPKVTDNDRYYKGSFEILSAPPINNVTGDVQPGEVRVEYGGTPDDAGNIPESTFVIFEYLAEGIEPDPAIPPTPSPIRDPLPTINMTSISQSATHINLGFQVFDLYVNDTSTISTCANDNTKAKDCSHNNIPDSEIDDLIINNNGAGFSHIEKSSLTCSGEDTFNFELVLDYGAADNVSTGIESALMDGNCNIIFDFINRPDETPYIDILNPGPTPTPEIRLSESSLTVTEATGTDNSVTYNVSLVPVYSGEVTVDLSVSSNQDIYISTKDHPKHNSTLTLVFNETNATIPQTVTVTGRDDLIDNDLGREVTITHTPSGAGYGLADAKDVTVTITDDNDTAGIIVSPEELLLTEDPNGTPSDTYTVELSSQPTGQVNVTMTFSPPEVVSVPRSWLIFDASNWNNTRTITVTGMNDNIDNNGDRRVIVSHAASGGGYDSVPTSLVNVVLIDDEATGILLSPSFITVTENQTHNDNTMPYTVSLLSKPSDNVIVSLTNSDPEAVIVFPLSLTFSPDNATTPQTVTVTGVPDNIHNDPYRTANITHSPTGGGYDPVTDAKNVTVTITDIDDPGPRKRSGDDNDWQKKPTFGKSWEVASYQLVENGFSFNGHTVDIVNNWHTDFPITSSVVGDTNTVHIKSHAADGFKWIKLYLGVPDRGKSSEAESTITLHLQRNHTSPAGYDITEIVHEQKEPLINVEGTSAMVEEVMCNDTSETVCYEFDIMFTVDAPLSHDVLALEAVDTKRRVTVTYLNEGVQFDGESLLDPATARIFSKLANQDDGVYIELTKQDRRYDVWVDGDGYLYYENRYGTFERVTQPDFERYADEPDSVMTRLHSEFGKVIQYEQERAKLVWDSSAIASELEDSYSIVAGKRHERMDQELLTEMEMQALLAQERSQNKMIYNWDW